MKREREKGWKEEGREGRREGGWSGGWEREKKEKVGGGSLRESGRKKVTTLEKIQVLIHLQDIAHYGESDKITANKTYH